MHTAKYLLAISSIIVVLGFGCARLDAPRKSLHVRIDSPRRVSTYLLYLPNRVLDILDVASFGITAGPGLNVKAHLGSLATVCFPFGAVGAKVGLNTHYMDDLNANSPLYLWLRYKPVTWGMDGKRTLPGLGFLELDALRIKAAPDEIKVGAHVLVLGVDVGIRVVDLLDAVTGFVLIDLNSDDIQFTSK
jgi:hypothetical protein